MVEAVAGVALRLAGEGLAERRASHGEGERQGDDTHHHRFRFGPRRDASISASLRWAMVAAEYNSI
jgi:hypothetical protein